MKNHMLYSPVVLLTFFLSLFFCNGYALIQDEKEEEALKKALRTAFPEYSLVISAKTLHKLTMFESNLFSVSLNDMEFYSSIRFDFAGHPEIPKVNFSFFVNDPYSFSPALENIVLPRTSLNIDPVIGKYYWEW